MGRPIINIRARYHRPGNTELFRQGLRTVLDGVKAHMLARRTSTLAAENPLEQYVLVFDFEGSGWSNLDWDAFHVTLFEGARHYPSMGSQIFVLNCSAPVMLLWRSASRLMAPTLRRKCQLVSPKEVNECMQRLVPLDRLPRKYGGDGREWPGPDEAKCFEDQVGEVLAAVYQRAGVIPSDAKPFRSQLQDLPPRIDDESKEAEVPQQRGVGGGGNGFFACCY